MPLPCIRSKNAKQCHARTKATGNQCLNPAAHGMAVCRFHGARKKNTILSGKNHPNFKHGQCTLDARAEYKERMLELADLKRIMKKLGMLVNSNKQRSTN